MTADFHRDHGFDPGRSPQAAHEPARVLDALDIQQDSLRVRVRDEVVQVISKTEVSGNAGRYNSGKPDADFLGPVEDRGADGPGLGDQRKVARAGVVVAKGDVQADVGTDDAQAIGSHQSDV